MGHSSTASGGNYQNVYSLQIASMLKPVMAFLESPKVSEVMIFARDFSVGLVYQSRIGRQLDKAK